MNTLNADTEKVRVWLGAGSINIFGRPFSGKDTQGRKLAELFSGRLLGGGAILRSAAKSEEIKQLNKTGKLFPVDLYMRIVAPHLKDGKPDQPLILSSLGRRQGEEKAIMQATLAAGHPTKAVILLNISEEIVWQRWEEAHKLGDRGRRSDDAHGALEVRLKEFRDKTLPVIEFYRQKNLLLDIDGGQSPDKVTEAILDGLRSFTS